MALSSTDPGFDEVGTENVGDELAGALVVREEEVQLMPRLESRSLPMLVGLLTDFGQFGIERCSVDLPDSAGNPRISGGRYRMGEVAVDLRFFPFQCCASVHLNVPPPGNMYYQVHKPCYRRR
jgi:hypothetical protein